ncbi:ryncolin-4-like [Haematobia irritans]|uniref:ryncolin-4-like n=1 Tax=Haematobia irritans TaxID=7368 RepID=UPI003F509E58
MGRRINLIAILLNFLSLILGNHVEFHILKHTNDANANDHKLLIETRNLIMDLTQRFDDKQKQEESLNKEMPIFDIRCDVMPEKCQRNYTPTNCDDATSCTKRSGLYKIQINAYSNESFLVECDAKTENGGWIVIQKRQDGSENFYRNWTEYKNGFGNAPGEFWIGLDKLYALTNYLGPQELLIILRDKDDERYARYSNFQISNESDFYMLKTLGKYIGNAGDSMLYQLRMKFSTKDQDNDLRATNCATEYMGAWWYASCYRSNLNGKYGVDKQQGINWNSFQGDSNSLEYVKMMIRRRRE